MNCKKDPTPDNCVTDSTPAKFAREVSQEKFIQPPQDDIEIMRQFNAKRPTIQQIAGIARAVDLGLLS